MPASTLYLYVVHRPLATTFWLDHDVISKAILTHKEYFETQFHNRWVSVVNRTTWESWIRWMIVSVESVGHM